MKEGGPEFLNTVFSVTDKKTGWYTSKDVFLPLEDNVKVENEKLIITNDYCSMNADLNEMVLTAKNEECSLKVTVEPKGYVLYNGGSGYFPILIMKENHHYSLPYFTMKGELVRDGKTIPLEGKCWFDRQIDNLYYKLDENGQPLSPGKWTWLGISIEDGPAISIWDYTDDNGQNNCFASILNRDGKQVVEAIDSVIATATDVFVSDKTGQNYPTRFTVKIPVSNMTLEITPATEAQEIISANPQLNKYEGQSIVKGIIAGKEVTGTCCVELVGNWQK
ncbi:lipocalin family protein [Fusibacter sp. 3D3]|uniref:lipocalin family protein n=1 Tax=Fusibacter sp. 3D3 TaxID=1048380 RepID=UPI001585F9BC|nr:lipocalin family protein [Fusibacter sp. 3D3]